MPYELKGNCVHKKGEDKPIPGGCHKTRAEAEAHMRAMYANVPDASKKARPKVVVHKAKKPPMAAHTDQGGKLNVSDTGHIADAITALQPGGFRGHQVQLSPEERKTAIANIRKKIEAMADGDTKKHLLERLNALSGTKSFTVTKAANGRYRWNCRSSVNARDRDNEIVSEKALLADVARTKLKLDDSEFWLYHVPYRLGGAPDWRGMVNGSLVETGEFDDTPAAKAIAEYIGNHPEGVDGSGWGVSIGFKGVVDNNGVWHLARIKERSVLPLSAASNPYTAFSSTEVTKMTLKKQQTAFLEELKKDPAVQDAAREVLAALETDKALTEAGVERKAADTEDQTEELPVDGKVISLSDEDLEAIAKFVDEAVETRIKALTSDINEALGHLVEVTKDYQERVEALEVMDEEAREMFEQPRVASTYERLKALSATSAGETVLDGDDPLAQQDPEKVKGAPKNHRKPFGL